MAGLQRGTWQRIGLAVLSVVMLTATACSSQAAYPAKAVEMIVAFPAGGANDTAARMSAKHLSAQFGVPVNVTNKAGGNQIPGVMSALSAPADGYTLLNDAPGTSSLHAIVKDLPYKMDERTFGPMMALGRTAFVVNGKSPWNSLKDVADAAKKEPEAFTWTRLGGTSTTDFNILQFLLAAGIDILKTKPVAFEGSGPGITAIAGGHVKFGSAGASAVLPLLTSGDLKVLGVVGDNRAASLPNVPTVKESGYPSVTLRAWYAVSGPKGLPANVMDRLTGAAKKIVEDPAYGREVTAMGNEAVYQSPEQMRQRVLEEAELFKSLEKVQVPK